MYPTVEQAYEPGERTADGTDLEWELVDSTYVNRGNGTYSESRNLVDYKYLVTEELPSISWQLVAMSVRISTIAS